MLQQMICNGCSHAYLMRHGEHTCPYCRHPAPKTEKEVELSVKRRIEVGDPVAIRQKGTLYYHAGNLTNAVKYLTKAAGLGDAEGIINYQFCIRAKGKLLRRTRKRNGIIWKRLPLLVTPFLDTNGRVDRAVKHLIIAANLGEGSSLQMLRKCYASKQVSKEDFAAALRAYQTAADATKSPQREKADAILRAIARQQK